MEELHTVALMGAARPYIGQVTCQGEGALQQIIYLLLAHNIQRSIYGFKVLILNRASIMKSLSKGK